jgi:glycosyltransferase involved in cell wall biosynthesis
MLIGIDARELAGHPTGVGRYLAGLLAEWSTDQSAQRHEFMLYSARPLETTFEAGRFITRLIPGAGGTWWEQISVPPVVASDHLDLWFAPAYTAPLRLDVPLVVTIHDISFVAHPEWFSVREGMRRRWICRRSAAAARAIIAVSEFTKREIIDWLGVSPDRIHVIPSRIVPSNAHAAQPSPIHPARTAPRVLYVGSIFNRRHVIDLIRAFAPIARAHADASLDIVGDDRTYPREDLAGTIAAESLERQVRWHQYVDDDRLRELYASARAFAFLSEYEGFGLTPLEALATGVPSVLVDTPVARETCGDAALYVPVNDRNRTTEALEQLLFDDGVRAQLLMSAVHTLARYGPGRAGRQTLSVIETAADTLK